MLRNIYTNTANAIKYFALQKNTSSLYVSKNKETGKVFFTAIDAYTRTFELQRRHATYGKQRLDELVKSPYSVEKNRQIRFFSSTAIQQVKCLSHGVFVNDKIPYSSCNESRSKTTLAQVFAKIHPDIYWIPSVWPTPQMQDGPTCGLLALSTALNYADSTLPAIPVTSSNKDSLSLLKIAKQQQMTTIGEIYDIHYFAKLAQYYNCSKGAAEVLSNDCSKLNYIENICTKLKNGNSVITSVDMGYGAAEEFPGNSKGMHSHWALVFGYFSYQNECYFTINQWGGFYIWSGSALFESNKQIPLEMSSEYLALIKECQNEYKEEGEQLPDKYLNTSLANFRFSLFHYPASALNNTIDISLNKKTLQPLNDFNCISSPKAS